MDARGRIQELFYLSNYSPQCKLMSQQGVKFPTSVGTSIPEAGDALFIYFGAVEPEPLGQVPSSFFCSITRTCGRCQKENWLEICFLHFNVSVSTCFLYICRC